MLKDTLYHKMAYEAVRKLSNAKIVYCTIIHALLHMGLGETGKTGKTGKAGKTGWSFQD